jgi:hypothetical protein
MFDLAANIIAFVAGRMTQMCDVSKTRIVQEKSELVRVHVCGPSHRQTAEVFHSRQTN